mgnify:FL=1
MVPSLNYIKTSNDNWPDSQAKRHHKKFINKFWKQANVEEQKPITDLRPQNRSNLQTRDITWDIPSVSHLLKRTVTGPNIEEINAFINNGMETSIQGLLADQEIPSPPGAWVDEELPDWSSLSSDERQAIIQTYYNRMRAFQKWWANRIMNGGLNITEVMTLFWHSYFASAYSKVFYPQAMYQQNNIFRTCLLYTSPSPRDS